MSSTSIIALAHFKLQIREEVEGYQGDTAHHNQANHCASDQAEQA
jgi:hypothetical protein